MEKKILNPSTGRFVNKNGTIGKKVLRDAAERKNREHQDSKEQKVQTVQTDLVKVEEYVTSLVPYMFQVCPFKNHQYIKNVPEFFKINEIYKQMNSLADEFTLINWSSGVFIAVDETRPYLFKFLIIGPDDTPYENGCFIFDAFLDKFPEKSPLVTFKTTSGGRVRFNPNLYNCGKVCLSLLGTWAGPSWEPNKSTILQIVVSIQALILVKNPYYNEPGYENLPNNIESEKYNKNIRKYTHNVAIIETLKNVERDEYHPFTDIIKTHFKIKKTHIMNKLTQWGIPTKDFENLV